MPVKIAWAKYDVSIVEEQSHLIQINALERLTAEIMSWLLRLKA